VHFVHEKKTNFAFSMVGYFGPAREVIIINHK